MKSPDDMYIELQGPPKAARIYRYSLDGTYQRQSLVCPPTPTKGLTRTSARVASNTSILSTRERTLVNFMVPGAHYAPTCRCKCTQSTADAPQICPHLEKILGKNVDRTEREGGQASEGNSTEGDALIRTSMFKIGPKLGSGSSGAVRQSIFMPNRRCYALKDSRIKSQRQVLQHLRVLLKIQPARSSCFACSSYYINRNVALSLLSHSTSSTVKSTSTPLGETISNLTTPPESPSPSPSVKLSLLPLLSSLPPNGASVPNPLPPISPSLLANDAPPITPSPIITNRSILTEELESAATTSLAPEPTTPVYTPSTPTTPTEAPPTASKTTARISSTTKTKSELSPSFALSPQFSSKPLRRSTRRRRSNSGRFRLSISPKDTDSRPGDRKRRARSPSPTSSLSAYHPNVVRHFAVWKEVFRITFNFALFFFFFFLKPTVFPLCPRAFGFLLESYASKLCATRDGTTWGQSLVLPST